MSTADTATLPTIAILGAGSMGRAILSGLLSPGVSVDGEIRVTTRTAASAARLDDTAGVTASATEVDAEANRAAVSGSAIVIVAVKPAMVGDLLTEIAPALDAGTVVVSVAAGVTTAFFEERLPESVSVARSMPNTPAVIGRGVTGISAGSRISPADLDQLRALFATVGETIEVPEEQLDALSTISGSGPAYVFYLIEQLTATAIDKGFTPEQAALLVNGTFLGASDLVAQSGDTPQELRVQVTSPKGTTERAIKVLESAGIKDAFDRATDAALARAAELAAG